MYPFLICNSNSRGMKKRLNNRMKRKIVNNLH